MKLTLPIFTARCYA